METEDANDDPPGSHGSIIQPTNPGYRLMHPDLAAIHDVAYKVLDIVGVVGLVNSIGDVGDKNISTKDKAGHIFQAAAGVFTLGEEGESEGFHGEGPRFDGGQDTFNGSSREAFRNAKEQNGVPRSQQPDKVIKPNTPEGKAKGLDNRNVSQHEFTNSKGEKVSIRKDKPAKYNDGGKGDQGPHYNAGKNAKQPKDLNQHHNY